MEIWLIMLIAYGVLALVVGIGVMFAFFRRHPDGAVELDELQLITFISVVIVAALFWPLLLLGLFVGRLRFSNNPSSSSK